MAYQLTRYPLVMALVADGFAKQGKTTNPLVFARGGIEIELWRDGEHRVIQGGHLYPFNTLDEMHATILARQGRD